MVLLPFICAKSFFWPYTSQNTAKNGKNMHFDQLINLAGLFKIPYYLSTQVKFPVKHRVFATAKWP